MPKMTTRVRDEWVKQLLDEYGTVTAIAERMEIDKSTAARWLSGNYEATGRFIGTVMTVFPVGFDDAFEAVEDVVDGRRRYRRKNAKRTSRA